MNQIQNIPLQGLTHSPSDDLCQDGELATCLGLISEDGSLHPIPQPQIAESFALPEGASIRLVHKVTHQNTIHSHYIIRRSNGSWYWCEKASDGTSLQSADIPLGTFSVNAVTAVGNILCFVGDTTTKYAFWNVYKQSYIIFSRDNFNYDISLKTIDTTHFAGVLNADLGDEFWEIFSYGYFGSDNEGSYKMNAINADKVIRAFSALDADLNRQLSANGETYQKYNTFAVVAIRLYDGSYYNISNIFRLNGTFQTIEEVNANADKKTLFSSDSSYIQYAYSIQVTLSSLSEIYDLIQGVDIFLTKGESFIDTSKAITEFTFTDTNHRQGNFRFHYMTPSLAKQTIDSMVFYHSAFIPKEDLSKPITLKRVLGTEESISLANLFRSDVGGKVATTYNNRLHIANINAGNITLKNTFRSSTTDTLLQYEGIMRVQTRDHELWWSGDLLPIDYTFLSVPVLEVSNITIYRHLKNAAGYQKATLKPTSSDTMGYSYFVTESDKYGISFDIPWQDTTQSEYSQFLQQYETSKDISITDSSVSVVKVSEAENPLVFQAKDSVQVGSSTIYALSVNTRPISEGQFGDAPLYAFTDEGVWVLTPSDEGTYVARQPASRDICSNPDAIVQIDDAVLFPTDRGILMQQGRSAQCITDVLDGYPFDFNQLISEAHAAKVLQLQEFAKQDVQYVRFRTFLNNGTTKASIIYDYYDSRIIVFNPDYAYAYVYSLKSQRWGTMLSPFTERVNIYPQSYALDAAGHILDLYVKEPTEDVPYFVCSRPFTLDLPDVYKTIFSAILRGYVSSDDGKCGLLLYGSNDLHHWSLIKTSVAKYIRGICGSPYKYFRIAIIGSLSPDESLSGLSVEFQQRWQNKLR